METFGDRLKAALKEAGYTQVKATQELGLSQNALTNYISKNRTPEAKILYNISTLLGVSMEWLLSGDPTQKYLSSIPQDKSAEATILLPREKELLSLYRQLDERNQDKILGIIEFKLSEEENAATQQPTLSPSPQTNDNTSLPA